MVQNMVLNVVLNLVLNNILYIYLFFVRLEMFFGFKDVATLLPLRNISLGEYVKAM